MRVITLVGVISCLCFSVGEGLRLRPFPISVLAVSARSNSCMDAGVPSETSGRRYGPLDVPSRVQNPGKRQLLEFANPTSRINLELAAQQLLLSGAAEWVCVDSLRFGSHLSGRAPPSHC